MSNEAVGTSFGTLEFGGQIDPAQAVEFVKLCMEEGCFDFDTAYLYTRGKSEEIMGDIDLLKNDKVFIATKANPWNEKGLQYDSVITQLNTSLDRLKRKSVDLFYLHAPDHKTPIEETLKAVDKLHKEGKFKEFGLSNYAAWEVVEIYYMCKENNYILPTVYQGRYCSIIRDVEKELLPCLRRFGIRFYAYNPLVGGLLTGRYQYSDKEDKQPFGRFFGATPFTKAYQDNFWHKAIFDLLDKLKAKLIEVYGKDGVSMTEAAIAWLYHHSQLSGKHGDKVVLGASKLNHLQQNLKATKIGPLHQDIVKIFDEGWINIMKGICPSYNR
ncbi:aflatoxin B1 aldehyde reductase member 2 [Exaiptasia diaphana]|uniref:NADP-dependent oxidoreductase domain-containing protein n=1 Tax=Exaiptasia diaphana TaxID=2652724 RepID=A0A913Y5K4_EXADI|nr:aflatoxin B1 aldehyde reductase member 2 [Exaiptasia diaphana]KXJ29031.1 Aflatoxin B1 aldehyde reductase member 2 [Exaiptasia diaphana]